MTRVTVDTNVLISALVFQGLPGKFLALALAGAFQLITSPILLDELDEKLRFKFLWSPAKADQARSALEALCDVVSTTDSLAVIQDDPDDDRVLECAVAGRADTIVSGDRHLLKLGSYDGTQILTVRQFMDQISPVA
jgi:putative PIN family toxin of toxin-antitoxin system